MSKVKYSEEIPVRITEKKSENNITVDPSAYIVLQQDDVEEFLESGMLSATQFIIYELISGMCKNSPSQEFYASNAYVAKRCGCNRPTANSSIKKLCDLGLVEKHGTSYLGTVVYTIPGYESESEEVKQPSVRYY